jgi:hypothetical protein
MLFGLVAGKNSYIRRPPHFPRQEAPDKRLAERTGAARHEDPFSFEALHFRHFP